MKQRARLLENRKTYLLSMDRKLFRHFENPKDRHVEKSNLFVFPMDSGARAECNFWNFLILTFNSR